MDSFADQLASLPGTHTRSSESIFVPTRATVRTIVPRARPHLSLRSTLTVIALLCVAGVAGHGQALSAQGTAQRAFAFEGVVRHVSDGDSIQVAQPNGDVVSVRLFGVDCPEAGQPFGRAALLFTRQEVFDKAVTVEVQSIDRYGRLVARVTIDGKDLSTTLVDAGLAWHYLEFSSDPVLAAAEKAARSARRGMWIDAVVIPPWVSRRRVRPADPASVAAAGEFRGNTRSCVYHRSSCKNAKCQNCSSLFKTEQAAQAAGYRPAGDCFERQRAKLPNS